MTEQAGLVVDTTSGRVRGVREARGRRKDTVRVWRGIPFAAPPVGPLRFRAPQPVLGWAGELDAREFGSVPVQLRTPSAAGGAGRRVMSEDCLTLNVYTPDRPGVPSDAGRPVIVWIYGGAFTVGAGANHPGERLALAADTVVVTFNYRLGALGFLDFSVFSTPDRSFDGNLGMLDQIAALEWVRDNIAAFGGDPGNVTIMGESAGGISVVALMCSPRASGLFHRAIAQSPAARAVTPRDQAAQWARQYAGFLDAGDPTLTGDARAVAALEAATPEQLVAASQALASYHQQATPGLLVHSPVVDGDVLPRHPVQTFEEGAAARVPLLLGANDNEGQLFQLFRLLTGEEMLPTSAALQSRMFALTDPEAKQRIIAAYSGYPKASARAQLIGDMIFWAPTVAIATAHARHSPTYMYRFDQSTPRTRRIGVGATHGADIGYVFGQLGDLVSPVGTSRAARLTSARMMRLWGRFAATGAPDVRWPAYDERRPTMIIDDHWRVEFDPRGYRHRAWAGFNGWE
ncbi:MAG: carboxylesterase/lipase family protein [Dermatophilus congolensis]|nr:carboxylesterase/lipase family protein [Dermatophilus congolensis]